MTKKILAVGGSFTRGEGLKLETADPALWVNQLVNHKFCDYQVTNLSKTGADNHWIFKETACALIKNHYDVVIVGWIDISRLTNNIGLELYPTHTMFNDEFDFNINNGVKFTGKWLQETGDRFRKFYNDHWSILDLIKYVNILVYMQETIAKSKIYFVNSLTDFPNDFFYKKEFLTPYELSDFEKNMLNFDFRDDAEIKELYNMIHSQYSQYGGIQESNWLNLYKSLVSMQVDDVSVTDDHPGYVSQNIFAEYLISQVKED
jgi:hypothetical protein